MVSVSLRWKCDHELNELCKEKREVQGGDAADSHNHVLVWLQDKQLAQVCRESSWLKGSDILRDKSHDCGRLSCNSWLASNYLLFTNIRKIVIEVFPKPMVSSSSCLAVWNLNNNITMIKSKVANLTLLFKQEEEASLQSCFVTWRLGLNAMLALLTCYHLAAIMFTLISTFWVLHINKITLESGGVSIWL